MRTVRTLVLVLMAALVVAGPPRPVEALTGQSTGVAYLPFLLTNPITVSILPNHSSYVTAWGSIHVVGEVWNRSAQHLRSVQVTASLYDRYGRRLGSESAFTYLDYLPSGYSTCFDVTFLSPPDGFDPHRYQYSLDGASFSLNGSPLPALTLLDVQDEYDPRSGMYRISGKVRNDARRPVGCVRPVGTLYDAQGRVIGCEVNTVEGHNLEPGEIKPFNLFFDDRNYWDGASYWLQVCGIE